MSRGFDSPLTQNLFVILFSKKYFLSAGYTINFSKKSISSEINDFFWGFFYYQTVFFVNIVTSVGLMTVNKFKETVYCSNNLLVVITVIRITGVLYSLSSEMK